MNSLLVELYRKVYLIRQAEEAIRAEYPKDEMKTPVHLCVGAEAIHAGVLSAFSPGTQVFASYRNHGIYLALTDDTDGFFAELFGRVSGCASGKAGSMHLSAPQKGLMLTSAVVATPIPVAVGAALANAYRRTSGLVAVFFGDGALEEGAFWESLNFACLHRLKIFFICEDNDLAIHTPADERQGFTSIDEAISGFRCHRYSGDGYDADQVYQVVQQLKEKMDKDPKPAFLHFKYFRFLEHVGIGEDFHSGYRSRPERPELLDPLHQIRKLAEKNRIPEKALKDIESEIDRKISESLARARSAFFPGTGPLLAGAGAR